MNVRIWTAVGLVLLSAQSVLAADDLYDEGLLHTLELHFAQSNWWSQLQTNYQSKTNLPATLTVDGVVYEGVGVRFRGNTSYMMAQNSQKKSYNIEIDYTVDGQDLMGYKTLNLINCMNDATFMREVLYSNVCRRIVPCAKANFVKLVINGENWGIYANVQQLNGEFIEDWFASNDGTRWRAEGNMGGGGQIPGGGVVPGRGGGPGVRTFEVNPAGGGGGVTAGAAALTWQGADPAAYEGVYELKNTKQDDPWASLIHTCDVLNNTSISQLPDVLESVLDVDRALWLCAFEIVFQDDDGYVNKRGSDYYLYYEPETGRMHLMQYDGNECMGPGQWALFYRADDSSVPLMYRLMSIRQYRQRYLAHVRTILDSLFTEEALSAKLDAYRALITDEVQADGKKLYSNQGFDSGITELKNFVRNRRASLLANPELDVASPQIVDVNLAVVQDETGEVLTVRATVDSTVAVSQVHLFVAAGPFACFAPVAMADDGLHDDAAASDGVFAVTLTGYPSGALLRYYVQATADTRAGTLAFNPPGAEHEVYTHLVSHSQRAAAPVVFNEIMAANRSTLADPQGDYDDWIELANVSTETVDLSGMYLSDKAADPLKWQFPDGVQVGPGEYLLVWADEDGADAPGLHANFKLSAQGETLWLFAGAEQGYVLLDSITFGAQEADVSFGRYPDGFGPLQALSGPSPLAANLEPVVVP